MSATLPEMSEEKVAVMRMEEMMTPWVVAVKWPTVVVKEDMTVTGPIEPVSSLKVRE